jgi:histidine triad (HIT) family protein
MSEPSIFTKIINGEIPSYKVYEDDRTLAFLDIYGVIDGHTLVIPKKEVEFIWDMDDEDYRALMDSVKKVGRRLRDVLGTKYVGVKVIGTDVPHTHVHLIPFDDPEDMHRANQENSDPDHAALKAMAETLHL